MIDLNVYINTNAGEFDKVYCEWFGCPKCGTALIMRYAEFCPCCGASIVWCEAPPEVIKPEARSDIDA